MKEAKSDYTYYMGKHTNISRPFNLTRSDGTWHEYVSIQILRINGTVTKIILS